jgi:prophage regulatory protein
MQHKLMRLPTVIAVTGLPKSTIYRKISENSFPKQYPLGPKTVAWLEHEIQKWIEDKIKKASNDNCIHNDNVKQQDC